MIMLEHIIVWLCVHILGVWLIDYVEFLSFESVGAWTSFLALLAGYIYERRKRK